MPHDSEEEKEQEARRKKSTPTILETREDLKDSRKTRCWLAHNEIKTRVIARNGEKQNKGCVIARNEKNN